MATSETKELEIKKTETLDLNLYLVRNTEGKWLRAKGYQGSGSCWVSNIVDAKIYTKQGNVMRQITFWTKNYPDFGIPELIRIKSGVLEYLDHESVTKKKILLSKRKEIQREIANTKYRINNYLTNERISKKLNKDFVNTQNEILEKLKKQLDELK